jgi:hypothetical protein
MRVALKPFHKWYEGNRWIAEGGMDGYGACGSTTTIDRGGGSKLVKNPQHRSLSALQRTHGCRVVPGSVGLHRSALRAMRRADRSGHSSQSSTTPYKCTRPRQEVVESVRVKRKKLPHVSMADSVMRVVSSYARHGSKTKITAILKDISMRLVQGAKVAIAGRRKDESECVRRDIERKGRRAVAMPGSGREDVAYESS